MQISFKDGVNIWVNLGVNVGVGVAFGGDVSPLHFLYLPLPSVRPAVLQQVVWKPAAVPTQFGLQNISHNGMTHR